jgi:hypothetical protein
VKVAAQRHRMQALAGILTLGTQIRLAPWVTTIFPDDIVN